MDNTAAATDDSVLPSTEDDIDPAFSFSAASTASAGLNTPAYVRADSLPPAGLPSRLQTQFGSFAATDCTSSAASSPVAASADLSVDNDRIEEIFEPDAADGLQPPPNPSARSSSPLVSVSHRAIMGGAAEFPQRSSSPLKRRASSMNAEGDAGAAAAGEDMDVDMLSLPPAEDPQPSPASGARRRPRSRPDPASTGRPSRPRPLPLARSCP